MGNDRDFLAEYYLRAAGVAAVWIDPSGDMGAQDTATINLQAGRIAYCCPRGAHFVLAYRLFMWKQERGEASAAELAARLVVEASAGGVGITEHSISIDRARAAVAAVETALEQMKAKGELGELNKAFKIARATDPSLRYQTFLRARKAAMLEAIAMEGRQ